MITNLSSKESDKVSRWLTIVNIGNISPAHVQNNLSTWTPHLQPVISEAINDELLSGRYIKCPNKPKVISALSAVPKPNGGILLTHDLSRPNGQSVNSYASKDYCKYELIHDALFIFNRVVHGHSGFKISLPVSTHSVHGTCNHWITMEIS